MDLAVGERNEVVALKKVEHALAEEIHNDADMAAEVEAVSQVDTSIPIFLVVGLECRQDAKLDLTGIAVFLN